MKPSRPRASAEKILLDMAPMRFGPAEISIKRAINLDGKETTVVIVWPDKQSKVLCTKMQGRDRPMLIGVVAK